MALRASYSELPATVGKVKIILKNLQTRSEMAEGLLERPEIYPDIYPHMCETIYFLVYSFISHAALNISKSCKLVQ